MIGVTIICEAKLKEKYLRDASDEYVKRLGAYCKLNIIELSPKTVSYTHLTLPTILLV